jgi:23S rRNA (uracil1939-C5)-methyltransferase
LAQLEYKQQAVLSLLLREAKIKPNKITDALFSAPYHYRRTARIGVNKHRQTNTPIVGFRRKNSSKILQVSQCNILPKPLSSLFDKLRECLAKIDNAKAITHIEYLQGDTKGALTFRCMEPLAPAAIALLNTLVNAFNLQGFIRYDHSLVPLADNNGELSYAINNINLTFGSGNFLQVNAQINQQMIDRAIQWLALEADDQVLDLFSGLGNFSLPMAKHVCKVTALEGSEAMVTLACENAALNSIENCEFHLADLTKDEPLRPFFEHHYTKVLLDPPRSGATELIKNLLSSSANLSLQPHRILYVACDPLSLAKDAKLLKELGYEMANFCVMDMFPNTVHIETMALFKKAATPLKKVKAKKNKSLFAH